MEALEIGNMLAKPFQTIDECGGEDSSSVKETESCTSTESLESLASSSNSGGTHTGGEGKCMTPVHRTSRSLDETLPGSNGKQLGVPKQNGNIRRGSACQTIHKIPTIVQTNLCSNDKSYHKKESLTEEEQKENEEIFQTMMRSEFPEEEMTDKSFRDKDKDFVIMIWILEVLGEVDDNPKTRIKKLQDVGEFEFFLQSGIQLCNLVNKVVPGINISTEQLKSANLLGRRHNIKLFLDAAKRYGVPQEYLFQQDDLVTLAHVHRVTRTLYAFGEQTNMDPSYTGPEFNPEKILRDLITQGIRRKSSCRDMDQVNTSIHSIFQNLMQDVQRKNSLTPRGPPKNIYKSS